MNIDMWLNAEVWEVAMMGVLLGGVLWLVGWNILAACQRPWKRN